VKKILFVCLLICSTVAQAEWSWFQIGKDQKHGSVSFYIDFSTIKKNKQGNPRGWILQNYQHENAGVLSAKLLYEADCDDDKLRVLSDAGFSGKMGSGYITDSNDKPSQWAYFMPESVKYDIHWNLCLKK
jgi:hypothetical protein